MTEPTSTISPDDARLPWERRDGETPRAFEAFVIFRTMGAQRSVTGVARLLSKSRQNVVRWATKYEWQQRAAAFDRAQDTRDRAARRRRRSQAIDDEFANAGKVLDEAVRLLEPRPLTVKGKPVSDAQGNPIMVQPTARDIEVAAGAMERAVKLQRLALGLPTSHTRADVELKDALELALATQEQLREIITARLCDTCRATVGAELRRLAQESQEHPFDAH